MTNTILGLMQPLYAPEGQGGTPEPQTPPASSPAAPQGADDDFQEEDIVISEDGDGGDPAEPGGEPDAAAQPRKKRGPKRYAELTSQRDQARSYAEGVAAENERLRREAADWKARAEESSDVAVKTYAAKAKSDLAAAERAHEEALTSNDAAKITAAVKALSSATSAFDDVEAFQRKEKTPAPAAGAPPGDQPAQQPVQDLPEHIKSWAVDNRWWDVAARDERGNLIVDRKSGQPVRNPDFNEEMHNAATYFAQKLERDIARGKVAYKTASPEYFEAINNHVQEEFPDYFEDDDAPPGRPAAPAKKGSPVAAPGGRSVPGAPAKNGAQSYKLSADEVRFITKSVANGGGPKYPKGHAKAFQPMTVDDAKVSFARRKISQAKESGAQ